MSDREEIAKLRHALAAETRALQSMREILIDGLRPSVSAADTVNRLWAEQETALDPAPEIEEAQALLHPERAYQR